ncbi:MAG: DUF58 domain-containing protein [Actinobacteria bacterium]|nr:DUF58 domain-containing protein [Actinomycetota bacterium]
MSGTLRAFGVEVTPERPGPGPMPDALLRALELTIARRVDGLLAGDHRSAMLGRGSELAQIRPYVPGDDVRLIDWNVTARMREPHVRAHLAERVLVTWLVLDRSLSMAFGTADRRKDDVAFGVTLAVGHAATVRGNRLGMLTFAGGPPAPIPPRQGRAGLVGLLATLRDTDRGQAVAGTGVAPTLDGALATLASVARQRALVAIVSDFRGPVDWRGPLLDLAGRHDVLAIEIRDPREQEIPDVGEVWFEDPESRQRLRVDTSDPRLRARFAEAAHAEREGVARVFRSTGAGHVVLSTDGDWLRTFAAYLRSRS